MISRDNAYSDFYAIGKEILTHPVYQRLKSYIHHGETSVFAHSVIVAYLAHRLSDRLSLDTNSVVRGALLHDFFLYDWHEEGKRVRKPLLKKHGFKHASYAMENATFYFTLNSIEKDIISKHMFPLNMKPPVHLESWVVNLVDDYVTFFETFKNMKDDFRSLLQYVNDRIADDLSLL